MSQREPEPERGLFIFGGCFGKRPTYALHCDDHLPYLWNCRDVGPTHDALVGSVVVLPYIRSVPGPEQTEAMPSRRQDLNHRRRLDLRGATVCRRVALAGLSLDGVRRRLRARRRLRGRARDAFVAPDGRAGHLVRAIAGPATTLDS